MHYRLWSGDCKEVRYHYTLTCKLDESYNAYEYGWFCSNHLFAPCYKRI